MLSSLYPLSGLMVFWLNLDFVLSFFYPSKRLNDNWKQSLMMSTDLFWDSFCSCGWQTVIKKVKSCEHHAAPSLQINLNKCCIPSRQWFIPQSFLTTTSRSFCLLRLIFKKKSIKRPKYIISLHQIILYASQYNSLTWGNSIIRQSTVYETYMQHP